MSRKSKAEVTVDMVAFVERIGTAKGAAKFLVLLNKQKRGESDAWVESMTDRNKEILRQFIKDFGGLAIKANRFMKLTD